MTMMRFDSGHAGLRVRKLDAEDLRSVERHWLELAPGYRRAFPHLAGALRHVSS
jgi:hypothetical protein